MFSTTVMYRTSLVLMFCTSEPVHLVLGYRVHQNQKTLSGLDARHNQMWAEYQKLTQVRVAVLHRTFTQVKVKNSRSRNDSRKSKIFGKKSTQVLRNLSNYQSFNI